MSGRRYLGALEGYYGPPLERAARLDLVRWLATEGGTDYVYAPKHDPWQRDRWRELYPDDRAAELRELVAVGREVGVDVGLVISPGLDWQNDDEVALTAKLQSLYDLGARSLGVAFDDVPPGGAELGARHGAAVAHVVAALPDDVRWAACPVDYATAHVTAYLRAFADALPDGIPLMWTGPAIVSPTISGAETAALARELGRPLVLADNWPVQDGAMSGVLHLGPYPDRDPEVVPATAGALFNLMPLPLASRIGVAAALRWWREPTGDREAQWRAVVAGVPGLEPLARAARSWLTDPGPDPELLERADAALAQGDPRLEQWLALGCRDGLPVEWVAELEDWLQAWEWEAVAMAFVLSALREGSGGGGAFAVGEAWRRIRTQERQLFGIRYALYPVTRRDGDVERADARGLIESDNLTDRICRRALHLLTGEI